MSIVQTPSSDSTLVGESIGAAQVHRGSHEYKSPDVYKTEPGYKNGTDYESNTSYKNGTDYKTETSYKTETGYKPETPDKPGYNPETPYKPGYKPEPGYGTGYGETHHDHYEFDSKHLSVYFSEEHKQVLKECTSSLGHVLSKVPWMKFRVLAEPDMGCFTSDVRLRIFIQKITEITVSIVTKQIHEEVTVLVSKLVTSILKTMATRISIVQKIVIDHIAEICSLEDTVTGCETLCDVDGEICIGGVKYPTKYPGGYEYGIPDDYGYKPAGPSYGDHEHPHGYKPEVPTYGDHKYPDGYKPEVPTYDKPKHPEGYKPEIPAYREPKHPGGYNPTHSDHKHPDGYKPEVPRYTPKQPEGYKPEVPTYGEPKHPDGYKHEGPTYGERKPPTGYGDTKPPSTPTSYPTPKPPTIYTDKPPISKYPSTPKPPSPPPTAKYPYPDLTKAKWIWTKDAITKKPGTPYSRPFRKVIKTESPVDHLSIIASCDRRYTLYVNGLLVGCGDNWENPDNYTVEFEPRKEVVIAVYGSEDTGKGQVGLLASGKLWNSKEDKPKEISFVSDESWKTYPGNAIDVKFHQPEYKDTTWESAYVVENYGGRHWGSLKPALPAPKKYERWTNKPGLQDAPEAPKAKLIT